MEDLLNSRHHPVETLRPAMMRSKPVPIDRVFDDPDAVIGAIRDRAPYPTMAQFHGMAENLEAAARLPWFRTQFDDPLFMNNSRWLQAAQESFSATIVQPLKCLININGPMTAGPPHLDLPVYRGFKAPEVPVWLLIVMSYSGLFHPWLVPIASGLAWFYRGTGGEFEYWPDGPTASSHCTRAPLWNCGVMSDNEFMWHRIGDIGSLIEQAAFHNLVERADELHVTPAGAWSIRRRDREVARVPFDRLRISLLWKAYVFADASHLHSFKIGGMDLTLDQVVEIFVEDLRRRNVPVKQPYDPFDDPEWRELLQTTYPSPF